MANCVDPNPLMVERQDPDSFTRFQTRERCALEIAANVFNGELILCSQVICFLHEFIVHEVHHSIFPLMYVQEFSEQRFFAFISLCAD